MDDLLQAFSSAPLYLQRCNLYFCAPGEETPQRILPFPYFLYVHSGQGIYNIGGQDILTRPGCLYFCPRCVPNTIKASRTDPFVLSGIEFETHLTDAVLDSLFSQPLFLPFDGLTRHMLDEMICHSEHLMTVCEDSHALFKAFLLRFLTPRTISVRHGADSRQILEYLYLHRLENITLESLSQRFHYHPNHLNRLIRSQTHMTVHQLIIEYRLQYACDLLRNSTESVTVVSHACGYENPNYFCQLFRQKRGCTPLEYRLRHTAPQ